MLQPTRRKYRKEQKGRNTGLATRGTKVSFGGAKEYVNLQVSHDPAQGWVLVAGLAPLAVIGVGLAATFASWLIALLVSGARAVMRRKPA